MKLGILASLIFVVTASGLVQPRPAFDPQDVVRQIRSVHPSPGTQVPAGPGCDAGEFLLDTSSTLVPAPGSQSEAAVGFDGTNFLVVWQDLRGGDYGDICGTRVTPAGEVLDPAGLVISQAAFDQQSPALAFNGSNFLVVWQDFRRGHAYDIYGTRVTPSGAVLDAFGIIISQASNDQRSPAVAFDGADFLVVWQDYRFNADEPDIYGARVAADGSVLDTAGFVISQAQDAQYSPVVGFDGANYLVAWQDCRSGVAQSDIYGARVTPGGAVIEPQGFAIGDRLWAQGTPSLAFDGTDFLVTWQDVNTGGAPVIGIWGARVSPAATVLDPSGVVIADGTAGALPAVGFDGTNFLVTWYEVHGLVPFYTSIWGRRVSPGGALLDSAAIVVSPSATRTQKTPAVGFGGGNLFVVWQDDRNTTGEPDLYGARVAPSGSVLDPAGLLITQSARDQFSPALGFDGVNFLVVWEDDRSGYTDIYGARVTLTGNVLDPTGIPISEAANWQHDPAIVFGGSSYLVVWQDYRNSLDQPDIYGARVATDGHVLDASGIAISQAAYRQSAPAISFGGGCYLVAWQDGRNGTYDIYGTRVTTTGSVTNPDGFAISQAAYDQCRPALSYDGANFLAVWEDCRAGTGYSHVYGARVTTTGAVIDGNGFVVTQAANGQYTPALDFDGANYLVAWADYRRSTVWPDVYGARVTPGAAVLDTGGIAITTAAKDQFAPAVAFNGTDYLVVYEDYRGGNNPDIYGAWVATNGLVSNEGAVLRADGNQTNLALGRGLGGELFLAFQGWAGTIGDRTYNTDRIWGLLNPVPGGGIEETINDERRVLKVRATVVRGVLFLPRDMTATSGVSDRVPGAVLLDVSGRKVVDLQPGANDVSRLSPGVYFVRGATGEGHSAEKIILTD